MSITELLKQKELVSSSGNPAVTLKFLSEEWAKRTGAKGAVHLFRKLTEASPTPTELERGREGNYSMLGDDKKVVGQILIDLGLSLIEIGSSLKSGEK